MKKLFVIGLILFSLQIYAVDIIPYWSLGDVKLGGLFKRNTPKASFDFNASAFKFYFYDRDTGLNFSLSPFYVDITTVANQKGVKDAKQSVYVMSFINTELAFNTLYRISDKYNLNLFTSFHIIDPILISRFQFNAGVEFAITSESAIFPANKYSLKAKLLSIRSGFKYTYTEITKKEPMFFLDIGIDIGSALFIFKPNYEKALKEKK
ncbi:hypothetical protein [Treponema denticola]|uniref:hypothetical protein n=1 Tax=Treponema denticola TaxID=158 RepID=UPI0020A46C61|nr:hypothetical protein [Treponema denticola]UTC81801.1 hypothetical protein HGJ18_00740 [Treponema denticola]